MAGSGSDEHDRCPRVEYAVPMNERGAEERPALDRKSGEVPKAFPSHSRMMFEHQLGQIILTANDSDKARDAAAAKLGQPRQFDASIESVSLQRDPYHPPVTGGNSAISAAPAMGASSATNC